nr:hypothetical protein [uncultured Adlercreutzia sp.]
MTSRVHPAFHNVNWIHIAVGDILSEHNTGGNAEAILPVGPIVAKKHRELNGARQHCRIEQAFIHDKGLETCSRTLFIDQGENLICVRIVAVDLDFQRPHHIDLGERRRDGHRVIRQDEA